MIAGATRAAGRPLVVTLVAALATLHARSAVAQSPAVDVADLPPLPDAGDDPASAATVLAAASVDDDLIVVGAAKREQSLGTVASAVTVVSADRIRRFGYRTVADALAGVAGVYLADNRLVTAVGIRGLQVPGDFNTRILVLVDGATVNEAWGAFAGVGYDSLVSIDDISRIEVIRGPVGAIYGTNAFFGIINIVTRGAAEAPRAWGRLGVSSINGEVASAGFSAGSVYRQLRGSMLAMNRIGDTTSVPDVGNALSFDGARAVGGSLVGIYDGTFGQMRAYRARRDSPFAPYDSAPTSDPPYRQYNSQLLVEGGHTHEVSKRLSITGRGYSSLYRFSDRIQSGIAAPFQDIGDARTFGAEVRGRYELVRDGKLGLTSGAEVNYNFTRSRAFFEGDEQNAAVVEHDFHIEGIYAELDGQPRSWLGFTGGVRFDSNSQIDRSFSPRAALFVSMPERYGVKLLYAEGFRNPSAFEGFFDDDADFAANPDIGSERIRSFEVVAWAKPTPGLWTRVAGFYWDIRDIVEQLPYFDPELMTDVLQFQNVGRYVTEGVEAEASYRNSLGWYAFAGAAYSRVGTAAMTEDLEFGRVVNAPKLTASTGISTPKLLGLVHVSTELTMVGRRATRRAFDGAASPAAPAWTGWNATLYFPSVRGFDITAGVRNLIGKRNLIPAPGDYDRTNEGDPTDPSDDRVTVIPRVPGEGREFYVKVGYAY
ncbi:MAG: TonB-dependent receptor plug domain-containing protein [Kofleriaceae bacterium]